MGKGTRFCQRWKNAAALPGVLCASPLETCAVYRLMIAFAMDALHLRDRDERTALLKRGAFDMRPFREYIERCESEGASFDLFDARRPFMQSAYDAQVDGEESIKPATNLVLKYRKGTIIYSFVTVRSEAPAGRGAKVLAEYISLLPRLGGSGYPAALNATKTLYICASSRGYAVRDARFEYAVDQGMWQYRIWKACLEGRSTGDPAKRICKGRHIAGFDVATATGNSDL